MTYDIKKIANKIENANCDIQYASADMAGLLLDAVVAVGGERDEAIRDRDEARKLAEEYRDRLTRAQYGRVWREPEQLPWEVE